MNSSFGKLLLSYKKLGIDSMCFIYHFEASKVYGELTKTLFLQLQNYKIQAVTSVLTLAEILAFEKLQRNKVLFEQTKAKFYTTPNLDVILVDETIAETAAILKPRYSILLPDAIQLATAIISGQKAFISNDRKLKKVKEIKVLILDDFLAKSKN